MNNFAFSSIFAAILLICNFGISEKSLAQENNQNQNNQNQNNQNNEISQTETEYVNPKDPYEKFNRKMYWVHKQIDDYFLKPVAKTYNDVVPLPIKHTTSTFFGNYNDIWIGFNGLLQGKPKNAANDALRVLINATLGIFGMFDVASELGLEKHDEDFGQTLAVWGVGDGPYLFLPILGPKTLRDAVATPVNLDYYWSIFDNPRANNISTAVSAINTRAELLALDNVIYESGIDNYVFAREAYFQLRANQINDGERVKSADEDDDYSKE